MMTESEAQGALSGLLMVLLLVAGALAWGWAGLFYAILALFLIRIFSSMGAL